MFCHVCLHIRIRPILKRQTSHFVETGGPVQLPNEWDAIDEFTICAIHRIEESVPISMNKRFAVFSRNFLLNEYIFVDTVKIVWIVWGVLEVPFDETGVRIEDKHATGV